MMSPRLRSYISSFVEIGVLVPEKIFEGFFLPYTYGHVGHFAVTSFMLINFHFLVPESLHTKFG